MVLAYLYYSQRLVSNLLIIMKSIYPISTELQLVLTDNLFSRLKPNKPPSIFVEGNDEFNKSYIIKRLLNKRVIRKGRGLVTKYLTE